MTPFPLGTPFLIETSASSAGYIYHRGEFAGGFALGSLELELFDASGAPAAMYYGPEPAPLELLIISAAVLLPFARRLRSGMR